MRFRLFSLWFKPSASQHLGLGKRGSPFQAAFSPILCFFSSQACLCFGEMIIIASTKAYNCPTIYPVSLAAFKAFSATVPNLSFFFTKQIPFTQAIFIFFGIAQLMVFIMPQDGFDLTAFLLLWMLNILIVQIFFKIGTFSINRILEYTKLNPASKRL